MDFVRALLGLPPAGTTLADEIDRLHAIVISVTMISATLVFVAAFWFCVRYRRRFAGQLTKHITIPLAGELTVIGGILVSFVAFWIVGYRQFLNLVSAPSGAAVAYVTAKQWMWTFEYPDGTSTNDSLVVPVGQATKLAMISRDVIHSLYVPAFRIKHDVLPGRYTTVWFRPTTPGRYPIFCAEYCGTEHSGMRAEVVVLSEKDYADWQSSRVASGTVSMAQTGASVAARRGCLACHTLNGAPHVGPTFSRLYESTVRLEDGRTVVADEAYLTRSMMDPMADRVAGFASVMPTYRGVLSPADTGAILELIKSLRDAEIAAGVTLPHLEVAAAPDAGEVTGGKDGAP